MTVFQKYRLKGINGGKNEHYLFHGCTADVAEKIIDGGFKIVESKGSLILEHQKYRDSYHFGTGIYLAEFASHGHFFSRLRENFAPNKIKGTVLLVRAALGKSCDLGCHTQGVGKDRGDQALAQLDHGNGLRTAEFGEGKKSHDSQTGREWQLNTRLREVVIPHEPQALPHVLIEYEMRRGQHPTR